MDPNTLIQLEASITGLINRILQQATVGSIPLASEVENGLVRLVNNLTSTNTDRALTAAQGKVLKDLLNEVNLIISSNDATLDTLQKVVDYIKANRTSITTLNDTVATIQAELLNVVRSNDVRLTDAREWTASTISQSEAETGTATTRRAFTAQRVRQSIAAYTQPFTVTDRSKLDGIAAGAQANVPTDLSYTQTATNGVVASSTGTNATIPAANVSLAGLMSSTDKAKLDGIAAGAQVNVPTNLSYTTAATSGTVVSSTGANAVIPAATTSLAGLMTNVDKTKLDGIAAGAQVNVGTNLGFTAGTTAGPVITSSTGTSTTLPTATATASGVVTTGTQTFAGQKNFNVTIGGSITGNAATATVLQTARTINGISFDGSSNITINAVDSTARIAMSEKGTANGVATLDNSGKIPLSQLNDAVLGQVQFIDLWNAATNTPALPSTPTKNGDYYIVNGAGSRFGLSFEVGDWLIANGNTWGKVDNTDAVSSVAGRTGNITLSTTDINGLGNVALINTNASTANFLRGDGAWVTPPNTTYSEITEAEISAGTASTLRTITGRRMKFALDTKADLGHGHDVATTQTNGFMSSADKTKLDGVAAGAQVNVATNLSYTTAATSGTVVSSTGTNATIPAATTSLAGLMTNTDKSKLDGIAAGAQVNTVTSVAGRTGAVALTKADVGLSNVDNTADANKTVLAASTSTLVNGTNGQLTMRDLRTLSPSSISAARTQFGFTSWNNNNTVPYADFILMRGYSDASGGSDNLVLFSKTGIGMRIYQQTFGSADAFAAYKDVAFTDGSNATGTWEIDVLGNAASASTLQTARTINGVAFNGSANITVTANTTNTLTRGTGLTGNNFNGSAAATWAVAYGTTAGTACQGNDSRLTTNLGYTAAATTGTITSSTGTNVTVPAATTSQAGLLTGTDKAKLDGIQAGAQVNVATNLSYTSSATTGTVVSSTGNNAVIAAATATIAGLSKLIDNLTTNDSTSALTAAQGRALKILIDGLGISNIANLQTELNGKVSTTGTKTISGLTTINHNVLQIGNNTQSNYIAFRGTAGDDQTLFTHTFIGERIWSGAESSELVLFKGNDAETVSGPDRIRLIAPQFVIDSYNTSTLGGTLDDAATSPNLNRILTLRQNGNLGLGTDNPVAKLDIHINVPAPTALVSPVIQLTNKSDGGCSIDFANSSGGKSRLAFGIDSIGGGTDESNFAFSTCVNSGPLQERLRITSGGNVGIGTNNPQYKLEVAGSFAATTKSFLIDHPTKPGMKLRYGSLEGPENGVYFRGRVRADIPMAIIDLPDYWIGLVDPESITVTLTPNGKYQRLYTSEVNIFQVVVQNDDDHGVDFHYTVWAERKDVDKLIVEC